MSEKVIAATFRVNIGDDPRDDIYFANNRIIADSDRPLKLSGGAIIPATCKFTCQPSHNPEGLSRIGLNFGADGAITSFEPIYDGLHWNACLLQIEWQPRELSWRVIPTETQGMTNARFIGSTGSTHFLLCKTSRLRLALDENRWIEFRLSENNALLQARYLDHGHSGPLEVIKICGPSTPDIPHVDLVGHRKQFPGKEKELASAG